MDTNARTTELLRMVDTLLLPVAPEVETRHLSTATVVLPPSTTQLPPPATQVMTASTQTEAAVPTIVKAVAVQWAPPTSAVGVQVNAVLCDSRLQTDEWLPPQVVCRHPPEVRAASTHTDAVVSRSVATEPMSTASKSVNTDLLGEMMDAERAQWQRMLCRWDEKQQHWTATWTESTGARLALLSRRLQVALQRLGGLEERLGHRLKRDERSTAEAAYWKHRCEAAELLLMQRDKLLEQVIEAEEEEERLERSKSRQTLPPPSTTNSPQPLLPAQPQPVDREGVLRMLQRLRGVLEGDE